MKEMFGPDPYEYKKVALSALVHLTERESGDFPTVNWVIEFLTRIESWAKDWSPFDHKDFQATPPTKEQ